MLLSARILSNVSDVNNFDYDTQASFTEGDVLSIYFQLIDLNKDKTSAGFSPHGRRYAAASGAVLQVTIPNIVTSKRLTKFATQPFAGDSSIWMFPILSSDILKGTYTLSLSLTEGSTTTNGSMVNALSISAKDGSFV